jgi:hypothetical protein
VAAGAAEIGGLRDWHDGNHPGYALGAWLREYREQVFKGTP